MNPVKQPCTKLLKMSTPPPPGTHNSNWLPDRYVLFGEEGNVLFGEEGRGYNIKNNVIPEELPGVQSVARERKILLAKERGKNEGRLLRCSQYFSLAHH